jgi:hypothetical protein
MKIKDVLILLLAALFAHPCLTHAQTTSAREEFSCFYQYQQGFRCDYSSKAPQGEFERDNISSAILHIFIPASSSTATISITYGKEGIGAGRDNTWSGTVLHRTDSMISIYADLGDDRDKIEHYVLFPKKGVGFSLGGSAFMGFPPMLQQRVDDLPYGSASVLRLVKYKQ